MKLYLTINGKNANVVRNGLMARRFAMHALLLVAVGWCFTGCTYCDFYYNHNGEVITNNII